VGKILIKTGDTHPKDPESTWQLHASFLDEYAHLSMQAMCEEGKGTWGRTRIKYTNDGDGMSDFLKFQGYCQAGI
jgi:hypothetical protein